MIASFLADQALLEDIVRILFVFVLITAAFILSTRNIASLLTVYAVQSFLLTLIAASLYLIEGSEKLLAMAALTLVSKVLLIPLFINVIGEKIKISRDLEFNYLEPTSSLLVSMGLIMLSYVFLSGFFDEYVLGKLFFIGAVIGLSLTLMGMLVIFSRKKVITKVIGYLTMENGVLLFGIFVADLPFVIEILIVIDLMILVLLTTILAIGLDSTKNEYHKRLQTLKIWSGREE
ncbi:MAG: hydrogenase subunit [Methanosarcina sp.]|jgi:hydrogenase-4 component E|nr:hydrogenase subunit [Methanosarcina sp.]MDD3316242.1 hydrogenase subunit [Methanosarcina sp.]MDD4305031.1 hydrogenase subunit [Methanosarcina sp.]MDD4619698.1 hydrogenase subunit [Methanosarcina sp.]NLN42773.1 hydrogenase subunit [Methanosarcina sp.]